MNGLNYTVNTINSIVNGRIIGKSDNTHIINNILYDSRLLLSPKDTIFFALKTHRNDGHKFINDLYSKGVNVFVIENINMIEDMVNITDITFILVQNTLQALQAFSAYHRKQFNIPTIGITGSNGKTIVKEWLYQILSPTLSVIRSPKSYNSQIGVPVSVLQINNNHRLAIFEAGISRQDEMQNLEEIIKPTIGILTNIGNAHAKNFDNIDQKIKEKLKLFKNVDTLIYCTDNNDVNIHIKQLRINTFTWSRNDKEADIFVKEIEKDNETTIIRAIFNKEDICIMIPFTDDASIENAIHCWATTLKLNIPNDIIKDRFKALSPIAMRMELKSGINNCEIINDSYNSDFNSLTIALDFMNQQHRNKEKVVILSDILQSDLDENELYKKIAQDIKSKGVKHFIGIGEAISRQKHHFEPSSIFYGDTKDFLNSYPIEAFNNQVILIKGARDFGFERISKVLQEKAHETILQINLNNLVKNMNYYRSKLSNDTKLMVMVKAFAYGSGNYEISNILEFHHADYLTVAYTDEGVELRKKGIGLPIMIMTPEFNTFESIIKYNLEPDIYSFRSLTLLENAINEIDSPLPSPIGIHIKVDTGMHRLGFLSEDIDELITRIRNNNNIVIKSIFSHLAGSDTPELTDFTLSQIETFEQISKKVISAFPYKILRHILNSAGISRFTKYQYDMVRLGIGIYGIAPCNEDKGKLNNVVSLSSTITQIKEYNAGETIGYGRSGIITKKSKIGVIPIGYADGLKRQLGNGSECFYVNGEAAPIIGNICMDMCMIDLTDIECKEGDIAVLFDDEHSVERIAKKCDTIPYEILTSISQRVKRIYFQE